jgi:opacity protein-like surface antigen
MELTFTADVLYHFQSSGSSQFFVHAGGSLLYSSETDSGPGEEAFTGSQFGFGGGAGVKLPLADAVKFRIGLRYLYMLESESTDGISFPGAHNIMATFGLSAFIGG